MPPHTKLFTRARKSQRPNRKYRDSIAVIGKEYRIPRSTNALPTQSSAHVLNVVSILQCRLRAAISSPLHRPLSLLAGRGGCIPAAVLLVLLPSPAALRVHAPPKLAKRKAKERENVLGIELWTTKKLLHRVGGGSRAEEFLPKEGLGKEGIVIVESDLCLLRYYQRLTLSVHVVPGACCIAEDDGGARVVGFVYTSSTKDFKGNETHQQALHPDQRELVGWRQLSLGLSRKSAEGIAGSLIMHSFYHYFGYFRQDDRPVSASLCPFTNAKICFCDH